MPRTPNLGGKWIVKGEMLTRRSKEEEPDMDKVQDITFEQMIEQKGKFVVSKDIIGTRIGVLNYFDQSWKLILVDEDDNGTVILVPKCHGRHDVWVGTYFESGFSGGKDQAQVVAHFEMRRPV